MTELICAVLDGLTQVSGEALQDLLERRFLSFFAKGSANRDLLPQHHILMSISFRKLIFKNLLIFGCADSSLRCLAFSSCGEWRLLFVAGHALLIAGASLVSEHGL